MKRKNSRKNHVSRTKKPKLEDWFPIDNLIQNPGYDLMARNIFKYLKLEDFSNCRVVCKGWKKFIDEDKYLTKVQIAEVMSFYSKGKYYQGFLPFHFVCREGSLRIVKLFLDNQVTNRPVLVAHRIINAQDNMGLTPLHHACQQNNILVVEHLLRNELLLVGIRSNNKDFHVVHNAAFNRDPKVIEAVLESPKLAKIDKNVTTAGGYTVFHQAAKNNHSHEPLAYLMQNAERFDLNVNQLNDSHQNVFHTACQHGNRNIVEFIIHNGDKYPVDLNLRDNNGCTPFHFACFNGRLKVVKELLKFSKKFEINVFSSSNCGYDGQDFAEHKGHTNISKLIKKWRREQSQVMKNEINDDILNNLEVLDVLSNTNKQRRLLRNVIKLFKESKEDTK